jgi:uncharacterized ferredoxin-like protein
MSVIDGVQAANENLLAIAKIGASAALRAPKLADSKIRVEIVTGEDLEPLVEIVGIAGETNAFVHGDYVVASKASKAGTPIVELLIGVDATVSDLAWNCGSCGFDTCAEFNRYAKEHKSPGNFMLGPSCNWKIMDHGMAMSYAAANVSAMGVECRLQADYGSIALLLGHLEGCSMCVGISLGPYGESVWYNRACSVDSFNMAEHMEFMRNTLPQLFVAFVGDGHPPFKSGPVWAKEPKFFKAVDDPKFMAKKAEAGARISKIVARERAKGAARKQK